jgi:hypothetical protein
MCWPSSSGVACAEEDTPLTATFVSVDTTTTLAEETRDPVQWPFTADSPWNTPIGSDAAFAGVATEEVRNLLDTSIGIWLNFDEFSHPVAVASPTDPLVTFTYDSSATGPGQITLPLPPGTEPALGVDSHLHLIDPETSVSHEFFGTQPSDSGFRAAYYVVNDLLGPGIGEGGTRAYGGSALGGLIRTWELEEGELRHALALALTGPQLRQGPVWPATEEDAIAPQTYRGTIPMGTLLAIPPTVDVESMILSPEGRMVARALQRYGAYVVDQAEVMAFYAEPDAPPEVIAAIRADLPRIRRELRIVTNNGPDRVGGGGTPTAPPAPPLE